MNERSELTLPDLLLSNIPREVVMGVEEALLAGAQRAYAAARGMNEGHLSSAVGQMRHFHMNEAFQRCLAANSAEPSPIRGNSIVVGRTGIVTLARFNTPIGVWNNARRSYTRRVMSLANEAIEPLVYPGLFHNYVPPAKATAFFVACFSGSVNVQPEAPISIQLAVPDQHMRRWLFRETVTKFLERSVEGVTAQEDAAVPVLRKDIGKKKDGSGR